MAKVKGYNPPETEFAYDDATGDRHYFGEFLRMVLGEGSISPRDPETDIVGKTRRGERPSQQGEGSDPQAFYRDIFRNCSKMWNTLPEDCLTADCVGLPPESTSKKAIWDAKLEHGVVCSYYDLFMRCCILFAVEHNGEMPKDECFPCPPVGTEMAWDFGTSEDEVDQEDSVTIAITGLNGPFAWEVSGAGFTLEHETTEGLTNTLHADETACGVARITVVGCNDQVVYGWVKCTAGQWVQDLLFDPSPVQNCDCWCSAGSLFVELDKAHACLTGSRRGGDDKEGQEPKPCTGAVQGEAYSYILSDGAVFTQLDIQKARFPYPHQSHCYEPICWGSGAFYIWDC